MRAEIGRRLPTLGMGVALGLLLGGGGEPAYVWAGWLTLGLAGLAEIFYGDR